MSIPPLVCSTPPPPDQCDDDKDHEDFDLSYSPSQEDDDDDENNGYDYGNYTPYSNYQTTSDSNICQIKEQEITETIHSAIQNEIIIKYDNELGNSMEHKQNVIGISDINENKLKCEDDVNIEDLNLKVDEEIESIAESNLEQIEVSEQIVDSVNSFDIPCNPNKDSPTCDTTNMSPSEELLPDDCDSSNDLKTDYVKTLDSQTVTVDTESVTNVDNIVSQETSISLVNELNTVEEILVSSQDNQDNKHSEECSEDIDTKIEKDISLEDDFGDFDEFQSVNIENNCTGVAVISENPWKSSDVNDSDFGDFTANFEDAKFQTANLNPEENAPISNNTKLHIDEVLESTHSNFEDNDDDFGDFDDFKSSGIPSESNEFVEPSQCHELPVLNLQSTENEQQIMDRIGKVLSSVFLEEISEPEDEFQGKLENLLSETWGHLMEIDERQPYLVNWNNSFGQKTLLRALCIDSRNILFGPKWSSNMPKFAANLSNAPLQPQKQASTPSSFSTQNDTVPEKIPSKPAPWSDPFMSDGQESCNTENDSAVITPRPTDLDVLKAMKPEKIYSNTLSVQPLRQINLPDTHIFTPTDSEIPRSKTIHYDLGPSVLLPESTITDSKNKIDIQHSNIDKHNNEINDNEYWEFQDYKGSTDTGSVPANINTEPPVSQENNYQTAITVNALPRPSVAYQTDLLQPIKIEPAMPALNWPDPGEVKGVYDDFSDFVSMTPNVAKKQDISVPSQSVNEKIKPTSSSFEDRMQPESSAVRKETESDGFDDDFDTFQSASSKSTRDHLSNEHVSNVTNQISPSEFVNSSPKVDNIKSDTISFTKTLRPNEALTQNVGYSNSIELTTNKIVAPLGTPIQGNLLQPTPVSFKTQSQQKTGQILQPLSLESYSQINWPSPGIDLQDLSRFNPVETLHSLKSELSASGPNKSSPSHANQAPEDDVWGEFVSSKPKQPLPSQPKKPSVFVDDDEWTDFISSPSVKPQNGLNTISLNVHTNSNMQKCVQNKFAKKSNQPPIDIPTLNYITPKSNANKSYNDKHFQNL